MAKKKVAKKAAKKVVAKKSAKKVAKKVAKKKAVGKHYKSAKTGKMVSKSFATANPDTTIGQKAKRKS